jgi:hypothetical protein
VKENPNNCVWIWAYSLKIKKECSFACRHIGSWILHFGVVVYFIQYRLSFNSVHNLNRLRLESFCCTFLWDKGQILLSRYRSSWFSTITHFLVFLLTWIGFSDYFVFIGYSLYKCNRSCWIYLDQSSSLFRLSLALPWRFCSLSAVGQWSFLLPLKFTIAMYNVLGT